MNILVLCTGNSCRSQMAEGYLKHFVNDKATIYSAGVETHGVNPKAIAIMKEDHIDISNHTSNNLNEYLNIEFDYILTVCDNAKEQCPFFPGKAVRLHCDFFDPSKVEGSKEEIHMAFTKTRNQIKEYCKNFVENTVLKKSHK
ncbi:arsenate reductase ArsC [Aquimarina sp. SS2-1]|uniref:arsenate reductase ArsC n=1 Tax=Aquimarina besae TaxID=3342247 RepID=UPI0036734226